MKIVLVALNAKYIHSNLAIRSINRYCIQKHKIRSTLLEFTINQQLDFIVRQIFEQTPDVLSFSCYIWNIELVKELVNELKKVLPNTKIILGGPEVSYDSVSILKSTHVDYVIRGEGERSFAALICALDGQFELSTVGGLTHWQEGKPLVNPPQKPLSLDEIPFAYEQTQEFHNRIIYYESSRGCPYNCSYCLSSIEKGVRFLSLERVFSDLTFFLERNVRQVKFVDRTFNCNKKHALGIWKFISEHDNGITNFHCEINADTLDDESVSFLSTVRKGLFQFEIGIQTTNDQTLDQIHRQNDFNRITDIVRRLQSNKNIHLHLDLIAGLPNEDFNSFGTSFNNVYALNPDQFQLGFLKVLKGSDIAKNQQKFGIVCRDKAPYEVLFTQDVSFTEMLRLKMIEEMVEMYYNSNRYKLCISYLSTLFNSPFALFEQLASFYEGQNYHFTQHSKEQTYTILFEFLNQLDQPDVERFKWLAKHDIYSHEKAKSLPNWLDVDLMKEQRQKLYDFYNTPQNIERFLPEYKGFDSKQIYRMAHLELFPFNPYDGTEHPTGVLFNYKNTDVLGNAESYIVTI